MQLDLVHYYSMPEMQDINMKCPYHGHKLP